MIFQATLYRPTQDEIAQLELFLGLTLDRIHQLSTLTEFEAARE
jgi:hypothetical protein